MTAPFRKRKADRMIVPGASKTQIIIDHAVGPFDAAVRRMDDIWGVDRLPELVSPETAAKYGSAMAKLNAAIEADDETETIARVNVLLKGLAAMNAEAEASDAPKADPAVWEYDLDGFRFAVIKDDRAWPALKAAQPDLLFFTMREVGNALKAYGLNSPTVAAIKQTFPAAHVSEIRPLPKAFWKDGDDINFGETE